MSERTFRPIKFDILSGRSHVLARLGSRVDDRLGGHGLKPPRGVKVSGWSWGQGVKRSRSGRSFEGEGNIPCARSKLRGGLNGRLGDHGFMTFGVSRCQGRLGRLGCQGFKGSRSSRGQGVKD